ncbi:hypothetical protein EROM_010850 [Encephalitozoon romaleae SJ-2008]|uniref:Uncharacterized protein n=1 Tax=Encephalitozoon romaleae (strain SJ-2008) TaxID=1178016 RepID=I7AL96_ENCRO|nr:hypothetical protein EROM_010850 [Encephalitozoon romaleae SJ-2008]AFN82429.1 hypothetical protein EROM_010850 [Encephalitozoon romaleae SJ-2008]
MNFTSNEEERLKEVLKSKRKEEVLVELSKEIERKEKEMMGSISQDYMDIISKCSDLEKTKQRLGGIINTNNELVSSISDAVIQYTDALHEIEENTIIESRLDLVVSELKEILGFIGIASEYESIDKNMREDPLYYYNMAKSVVSMEKKLCLLEKYRFFVSANQICIKSRKMLVNLMMKDIDLWIGNASNNVREGGVEINRILWEKKESHIFDPLGTLRDLFISKTFLCILHESRRLGAGTVIVERVNEKRKEFVKDVAAKDDPNAISDTAGFILWSHYLESLDTGFRIHAKLAFDILSRNKMLFESHNFSQIREALISLRRLTVHLGIDYESVDRIISSVAINYFETRGPKDIDPDADGMEQLKSSMMTFIDECNGFVSSIFQFSNELDELLAKRIDQHLCSLIDRSKGDMDSFIEAQSTASEILKYSIEKNDFYRNIEFRCLSEIDKGNKKFMEEVIKQKEKEIDELFKIVTKNDDFGVDLLKVFSMARSLKFPANINTTIKRTLVCYIRDRFAAEINDKSLSPQDKKVVEGHLCSFYGYLRNNEPSLHSILEPDVKHERP